MSKYQAYPEYKDSGVEWVGSIPAHWVCAKTAHFFKVAMGQTILKENLVDDGEWPVFSATEGDHYFGRINDPNVQLNIGDIVIPARGNSIGAIKLVKEKATTSQTTIYCKQSQCNKIQPSYIYYFFIGGRKNLFRFTQTAIPQITTEEIGSNPILIPTLEEQEKIASFLDHETAKIDTLIDKQQQLIQLLKEKRQAVISHAVTKGLPSTTGSNAPMRDSGVEWLGEVPVHWIVSKVKFEYENLDSFRIPLSTEERSYRQGEYPYYGASGVIDYVDNYIFDEGLVLVSEDGANLLARSSKIAFPAYGKYWVNNHAHILRPKDENIDFWAEAIEVRDLTPYISGAAQPKFTSEALSNLVIAAPTNSGEINRIAEYIRDQKEIYSNLISKANKSIKLMQERRTALISAAVTGKIDVRHHASRPAGNDTSEFSA